MIYLFYGEDSFRAKEKIDQLKKKFVELYDPSGTNIETLDVSEFTLEAFFTRVKAQGFLSSKKLIILKNIFSHKKAATLQSEIITYLKALKNTMDENYILFWQEDKPRKNNVLFTFLLKKCDRKCIEEFAVLKPQELTTWIQKHARQFGKTIDTNAAAQLLSLVGNDTWQLHTEIQKLCNAVNEQRITSEQVDFFITDNREINIFQLLDAISAKNKPQALQLMELYLRTNVDVSYLVAMIIRQFRLLAQTKGALQKTRNAYAVAETLSIHPFVAQKMVAHERNFSSTDLALIYERLVAIDFLLKRDPVRIPAELTMLVTLL